MTHAPDITELIPHFENINLHHMEKLLEMADKFVSSELSLPNPKMASSTKIYYGTPDIVHKSVCQGIERRLKWTLEEKGYRVKKLTFWQGTDVFWLTYDVGIRQPPEFVK